MLFDLTYAAIYDVRFILTRKMKMKDYIFATSIVALIVLAVIGFKLHNDKLEGHSAQLLKRGNGSS